MARSHSAVTKPVATLDRVTIEDRLNHLKSNLAMLHAFFEGRVAESPAISRDACLGLERVLRDLCEDMDDLGDLGGHVVCRTVQEINDQRLEGGGQ